VNCLHIHILTSSIWLLPRKNSDRAASTGRDKYHVSICEGENMQEFYNWENIKYFGFKVSQSQLPDTATAVSSGTMMYNSFMMISMF
jgi:hypothetical protein